MHLYDHLSSPVAKLNEFTPVEPRPEPLIQATLRTDQLSSNLYHSSQFRRTSLQRFALVQLW
jgi:hypothetical protein